MNDQINMSAHSPSSVGSRSDCPAVKRCHLQSNSYEFPLLASGPTLDAGVSMAVDSETGVLICSQYLPIQMTGTQTEKETNSKQMPKSQPKLKAPQSFTCPQRPQDHCQQRQRPPHCVPCPPKTLSTVIAGESLPSLEFGQQVRS